MNKKIEEFQIEWLVPPINTISGQAYWTHLIGCDTPDKDEAMELYQKTCKNYNGRIRLVKVIKTIIAER